MLFRNIASVWNPLQAWSALQDKISPGEGEAREPEEHSGKDKNSFYNDIATFRACSVLDPEGDSSCRFAHVKAYDVNTDLWKVLHQEYWLLRLSVGSRRQPLTREIHLPRIYVYDLPAKFNRELSRKYKRCSTDQYGTEVFFHEALLQVWCEWDFLLANILFDFALINQSANMMLQHFAQCWAWANAVYGAIQSSVRTKDPTKADMFFVPIYGECFLWIYEMLQHVGADKAFSMTNDFFLEAITIVKRDVSIQIWQLVLNLSHLSTNVRLLTIFLTWFCLALNTASTLGSLRWSWPCFCLPWRTWTNHIQQLEIWNQRSYLSVSGRWS